ncbi:hypothetical protein HDU92_007740 [Lobulomyces angularis]|nr:hypothetical protein HDU92_007740 [Lobulomyces angularis]
MNDLLIKFLNEYGTMANMDTMYHTSFKRIINTLNSNFPWIKDIYYDKKSIKSEKECTIMKKNRSISFHGKYNNNVYKLFELPYPTKDGYFILGGVSWTLLPLEVSYTTMLKLVKVTDKEPNILFNVKMRKEGISDDFKETNIFLYKGIEDVKSGVYLNSFYNLNRTRFGSSMINKCVDPFIVYIILNPEADINNYIDDIKNMITLLGYERDIYEKYIKHFVPEDNIKDIDDCHKSISKTMKSFIDDIHKIEPTKSHSDIIDEIISIVEENFFNFDSTHRAQKTKMLMLSIIKLLNAYIEKKTPKDFDNLIHKRIDTPAFQIERIVLSSIRNIKMESSLKKLNKKRKSEKKTSENDKYLKILSTLNTLCNNYTIFLSSGNKVFSYYRVVEDLSVQITSKRSYLDIVSQIRKVRANVSAQVQDESVRKLSCDHIGYFCVNDTNEGVDAGLVKYLAISALITDSLSSEDFDNLIDVLDSNKQNAKLEDPHLLFLNGVFYGYYKYEVFNILRDLKINNKKYKFISVTNNKEDFNFIYLYIDKGRLVRPLLNLTTNDIEYLDPMEITNRDFSIWIDIKEKNMYEKDKLYNSENNIDFVEIDKTIQLGVAASLMPFPNHSQCTRVSFSCNMARQSITQDKYISKMLVDSQRSLVYGSKQFVSTKFSRWLNNGERNTGQNIIVAIYANGYNMEDALVLNRNSVENGLFMNVKKNVQIIDNYLKEHRLTNIDMSDINTHVLNDGIYREYSKEHKFDKNGIININSVVNRHNTIMNVIYKNSDPDKNVVRPIYSIFPNDSKITEVKSKSDSSNNTLFTCIIGKKIHRINIGDKSSSNHSQKGIFGKILDRSEMIYTREGIVPDIIMNPHSFPSRMTIGQMIEMTIGKIIGSNTDIDIEELDETKDSCFDASAFREFDYTKLIEDLEKIGFELVEEMYNPDTGEKLDNKVFIGVCNYMLLKQFIDDKMHFRTVGPVKYTTKHPTEGKAESGGLKLGIMEYDALVVHEAFNFIVDKIKYETDKFITYVCKRCNSFLNVPEVVCPRCSLKGHTTNELCEIDITNSFRMISQYLTACGVVSEVQCE